MTVQLAPDPKLQFFNNQGDFLAGGQLLTYAAGTSNPQATWTDSTQTTVNQNPVILNARGEASVWFNTAFSYKLVLQDQIGNQIWTQDNIPGGSITLSQITQSFLGGILWPQSASEIAAGVSPTNLYYQYGNVLRYGADPTGTNDSSVAFQAACNSNAEVFETWPGGGKYLFSNNTVQINNYPLTIRGQVRWPGSSGAIPINGSQIIIGSALGSLGAFTANSAVYGLRIQNFGFSFQSLTQSQSALKFNNDLRYSIIEGCAFIGGAAAGNNVIGINFASSSVFSGAVVIRDNYFNAFSSSISIASSATTLKLIANEFYGHGGINAINSFGILTGGSGYTSATYNGVALTGGTGTGATANITVAAGVVTQVNLVNGGTGYANTDTLSASGLGAGTSFSIAVATVGNIWGFGVQITYPALEPLILGNYFEGFSNAIYGNGSSFVQQTANIFGQNFNHYQHIKTSYARMWLTSIGNQFEGTGNVIYSSAITDNCLILDQGYFFVGGTGTNLTLAGSLGINGSTPPAQVTGWGTPTAGAVVNNFPGSGATTAQCGSAISELLTILLKMGIVGG
jgi:hypothetical protein